MRYDPWTIAGLIALVLLSLGVVQLYRSAPRSVEQVRNRALLAARPNAYAPRIAQAREQLRSAAGLEDDSAAAAAYAAAAEHAWRARRVAEEAEEATAATGLWAQALLGWAERLRVAGTGRGLRSDDEEVLRQALSLVERVLAVETPPAARRRAEEMRDRIQRQLRTGPLEWLPLRR